MLTTALTIEKLVYGGEGLSRVDGQVVLTPFVLANEEVRVETAEARSGVLRAKLVEVTVPAAARVEPRCPYYGRCGGCHYQHASYDAQIEIKQGILRETLLRGGKIEAPAEIAVVAGEPWGYRNRAQFHIEGRKLGYRERGSHKLIAIEECPISSPRINECIVILNGMLRDARWPKFIHSVEVFTDETQVQVNVLETDQPVAVRFFEWLAEKIPGLVTSSLEYAGYRVSHNSFFQVNRFLIDRMVDAALEGASGETALDLYAGVGLFTLPLARKFRAVTAVESGTGAIRDLEFNATRAGLDIGTSVGSVDAFLENRESTADFVLADPPRTGLGKFVVAKLAEQKPRAITIVSCDPATLARDLAALTAAGYTVERMTLIDLFPQTFHIETIVSLRL